MDKKQATADGSASSKKRAGGAEPSVLVVAEGPALTSDGIADRLAAIDETYGPRSPQAGRGEVVVVDGFGARVVVEHGHLELHDGVGEHRRLRRFAKVDAPRRLVLGIGTVGIVSLDALRWCARVGVPVVILGADGAVLAGGPPGRDDARLLRAQALALYGPTGIEIVRHLIAEKLRGQARVTGLRLGEDETASTLAELVEAVEAAESIEEVRQIEAAGANVYFAAWERSVEVTFIRRDLPLLPSAHWSRFNGRRSPVNPGSARSATDPAGAMLNYAYKLAEIETTLAIRRMGLSESVGVLHADAPGRPSFSCDLMETVRPLVDQHVLDLCAGPLLKRYFAEDARGVVRCLAPLTHRMAEAMPSYAVSLGPVVEHVAGLLATSSPYDVNVPSLLTGAKHKAAARRRAEAGTAIPSTKGIGPSPVGLSSRGRRRTKPTATPSLPVPVCKGCGGQLPVETERGYRRPRTDWCASCLPDRRGEIGSSLPDAARQAAERFARVTGTLPTHTPAAQAARSAANKRQVEAEREHEAASGGDLDSAWYLMEIQPRLAELTLPAIARTTGVSTSAASKWRAGRALPHRRHWKALAKLVGDAGIGTVVPITGADVGSIANQPPAP